MSGPTLEQAVAWMKSIAGKTTSSDDKYGVLFGESGLLKITALAYAAGQASKVPEGWKLVPVEPTDQMIKATSARGTGAYERYVFEKMLAAAPSQEGGAV